MEFWERRHVWKAATCTNCLEQENGADKDKNHTVRDKQTWGTRGLQTSSHVAATLPFRERSLKY